MHPNSRTVVSSQDVTFHNDPWRVRHGYREMQVHKRAPRRNRDFKDVKYGDHLGIERYRRTERFRLLKLLPDIFQEEQQKPIRYFSWFLRGAVFGTAAELFLKFREYTLNHIRQKVVNEKYEKLVGEGDLKFGTLRGALCGGLTLLAYRFGMDMRRHHREHNNRRPILYDHLIVTPPIVAFWSLYFKPQAFTVAFMASAGITLLSYSYFYLGKNISLRPFPKVFYTKDTTDEEIERLEFDDQVEEMGFMLKTNGSFRKLLTNGSPFQGMTECNKI